MTERTIGKSETKGQPPFIFYVSVYPTVLINLICTKSLLDDVGDLSPDPDAPKYVIYSSTA